nr:dTDP-4-dehydrorhamnose 3,5-epimerase [Acidobacteriota bacterium]
EDHRGFFARTYCEEEFRAHGLETHFAQSSIAFSSRRGTLRGMHYQREPFGEVKLVRCTRGAVYDAVIDLRPGSPAFRQWFAVELTAENRRMLYIPKGFAHGYQTLEDETEISYQMSTPYHREAAAGVRWNDPAFAVRWPIEVAVIAERDDDYPDFQVS